jgi:cyanophycinase
MLSSLTSTLSVTLFILSLATCKMVLVGGGLDDDNVPIYKTIIDLANRDGKSFIGIVTAASETPEENGKFYIDIFKKYGVGRVEWIPISINHTENNRSPKVLHQIQDMNGFFFGGKIYYYLLKCVQEVINIV